MADTSSAGQNPPVAETPKHSIRVPKDVWGPALAKARRRHETLTAVIIRALLAYVEDE